MQDHIQKSWERFLHPEVLKKNIITASIFLMAFEMLKTSIIKKIEGFFTRGFDEKGMIVSPEYKEKVLSLNRNMLYASLKWLQDMGAIDQNDLERFEKIKKCRNELTHEMLKFTCEEVEHDVEALFGEMFSLLKKIEIWWFKNLEMEINPEVYPPDLDLDQVIPGPVWSLQMIIDIALGPEEKAFEYYNGFIAQSSET